MNKQVFQPIASSLAGPCGRFKIALTVAGLALAFSLSQSAQAATQYWDVNGSGTWSTSAADWSASSTGGGDVVWTNSNDAVFSSTAETQTGVTAITMTSVQADSILFNGVNSGGYTFSNAGTLSLILNSAATTGTLLTMNSGVGPVIFNGPIIFGVSNNTNDSYNFNNNSSSLLTFNGSVSNDNNNGSNSSTGESLVLGGTGTGGVTFSAVYNTNNTVSNRPTNITVDTTGAGATAVTTLTSGLSTYNGGTTITSGIVQLNAGANLGAATNATTTIGLTVGTAGQLNMNGDSATVENFTGSAGGLVYNNNASTTSTLTIGSGNGGGGSYAGVIENNTGSGGVMALTKIGTGTITLTGADTYSGATTVNGGTLTLNGAAGALANTSSLTINGGGNFNLGDGTSGLANRINQSDTLTLGGANSNSTSSDSGTLTIIRGSATANSQNLASLTVNLGSNQITNSATTGGVPTLTFTGANPYIRNLGGFVNLGSANMNVAFNTTPGGAGNVAGGLLVGANLLGNGFVAAGTGTIAGPATTNNTWAVGNNTTVTASSAPSSGSTTNSLEFNAGAFTVTLAGANTITSGGILVGSSATSGNVTGGSITTGSAGGDMWIYLNGKPLTINSAIVDNSTSSMSVGGSSTLTLGGADTYTGPTNIASGATLAIASSGGLNSSSAVTVAYGATLTNSGTVGGTVSQSGAFTNNATGVIGGTVTVNSPATFMNNGTAAAVTISNGASATLNGGSSTGPITISNGTLTLGGAGAMTVGNLTTGAGNNVVVTDNNSTAQTLTFSGASNTTAGITSTAGVLNLNGGTVTLPNNIIQSTGAGSVVIQSGVFNESINGGYASTNNGTITVTGGTLNIGLMRNGYGVFTVNGGTLNIETAANDAGNDSQLGFGSGLASSGSASITVQSGVLSVDKATYNSTFTVGNAGTSGSPTLTLLNQTGGTILWGVNTGSGNGTATNLTFGSNSTINYTTAAYNLSGGTALFAGTIASNSGAGTNQYTGINWTGGTLTFSALTAANFNEPGSSVLSSILTNNGANGTILAPGGVGTTGMSTITGGYSQGSNGTLAIDLSGATASVAFQDAGLGKYDDLSVSGATVLGGKLNVGLLSYTPASNNTTLYNILVGSASGVTGNFTNLVTGTNSTSRIVLSNGLSSMLEAVNNNSSATTTGGLTSVGARTVALGGYQATNLYNAASGNAWDAANAASWTNFDPGSTSSPSTVASGAIADFADGGATGGAVTNTVNLNSTRNIQGILFASATTGKSYAISNAGSGAIILDNTANSAAATINDTSVNGQNSIGVPITLNSNLNVGVTNAAAADTISGIISGAGKTLTMSGAGTLNLSGANTYSGLTTLSAGTLNITGTVAGALTMNAGTASVGSNGLLGGALIVNNGTMNANGLLNSTATIAAGTLNITGTVAGALNVNGGSATVGTNGLVSGAATVTAGTMNANGLLNSTVTIGSAGTLTGSGTIGGLLTLNAGASTINLVNGVAGTLTLDNGLTLNGGNILDFDLGASSDLINLASGTYTFAGANDLINITKIIGSTVTSGTYNLITGASGINASNFTLETGSLGALNFSLATNGNTLQLVATATGLVSAYWNGTFDSTWNTSVSGSSNWNTDASSGINAKAIPTAVTDVYFAANGVGSPINTTLGANFAIESLNVLANVGTVTIGGSNSLTLEANSGIGGINVAAGNSVTLNPETTVILGSSQAWTNNSALLNVQSNVTDAGSGYSITTSGSGVTVLSGSNSYAGNILSGGELSVSSDSNLGGATNALTFNGGTLQVTGNNLQSFGSHTVTFNNGQTVGLDINSASNVFTVSQVLNQGAGGLTLNGAGTVVLTASNTYTGVTTINTGTLRLGTGVSGFDGSISSTSGVVDNGALVFDNTGTQSIAGGVSGTGSVSAIGSGTATLAGVNSFTGGITVNPGATLSLTGNSTAVTGSVLIGVPTVASVSTLNVGSATQTAVNGLTIGAANTVQLGNTAGTETGANLNVNGASGFATTIVNNGTLALDRGSTLTLNANSSWTQNGGMQFEEFNDLSANLDVNSGGSFTYAGSSAINFTDGSPSANSPYDEIVVNGGTFTTDQGITFNQASSPNTFNGFFELTGGGTLALSANISSFFTQGTVSSGSDEFVLGTGGGIINTGGYATTLSVPVLNVSGQSGSLTVTGGGTLALTNTGNNFSGGLTVANGDLQIGAITNASTVGETGSNTSITLGSSGNTGTLEYLNTVSGTTNMPFTLSTGGTGAFLVDSGAGNGLTLSGAITGSGSLVKNGPGTLTINAGQNVDTYTGSTIINSGTVALTGAGGGSQGVFDGTPTITVNSGATLLLLATVNDELGYTTSKDALVINDGTVANNATGIRQTLANTLTMTGGTLAGTSAGDSNTGAFSWSNATGLIATSDASGNAATISAKTSLQAAAVAFNVTRGTAVSGTSPDLIVSGVISEYGSQTSSLTKTGNGIAEFTAANTYAGATVVNGGELQIGNGTSGSLSASSALSVTTGTLAFDQATATTVTNNIANSGVVAGVEGTGITNTLGGIISGAGVFVQSGAGTTALTGINTYTGATTVSNGTLQLGSGGSLAGTTVTVGGVSTNATLQVNGNYTMGTSGTAGLVLAANTGTISLVDGSINTLTVSGSNSSLTLGGNNTINLEINGSTSDEILLAGLAGQTATVSGVDTINLTALGTITTGTDVLISAPGGGLQNATFNLGSISGAFIGTEQLVDTGTSILFEASSYAVPGTAYFSGVNGTAWNAISSGSNVNFNTDATSNINTNQLPGSVTNVHFYTSTPAGSNLGTVLGQNFTINSLTIDGTATGNESNAVSIGGTNVLTILASGSSGNTVGNGISVGSGAGALTITSNVALGGSNTWTNNSANAVTVSGTVTGGFALTTSGTGTIILTAADGYTGASGINAGSTLQLGAGGTVGSLSTSSAITDNGNLFINRSNAVTQGTDFSAGIGGTGSVTWSGPGTLTLNAANTFSGGLVINSGTVSAITNAGALGGGSVGVASGSNGTLLGASLTFANPISLAGGGTLTLGQTAGTNNAPIFTGGATGSGNLVFNDTGTGTLTVSTGLVNNGGTIANNSTGTGQVTLSANLGSSVGVVTENSATSQLNLTGANTSWAGGLTIAQGTVNINTTNNALGTGTLTLGAAASSANDTLEYNNGGATSFAYANAINVLGTGSNTLFTNSGPLSDSGPVTLNNNTLSLLNNNGGGTTLILSGTIGGTGNIALISTAGGGQNNLTGALNFSGTISNIGTSTGQSSITGAVGTGVSQIIENSAGSALLVQVSNASTNGTTKLVDDQGTLLFDQNSGNNSKITGTIDLNAGAGQTAIFAVNGGNSTDANPIIVTGSGVNELATNQTYGSSDFTGNVAINAGDNLIVKPTTDSYTFRGGNNYTTSGVSTSATTTLTLENNQNLRNGIPQADLYTGEINIVGNVLNQSTVTTSGTTVIGAEGSPTAVELGPNVLSVTQNSTANNRLIITGSNTGFAGQIIVTSGTLSSGSAYSLYNTGIAATVNGGIWDLNGFNSEVGSLSDGGVTTGIVTNSGAAAQFIVGGSSTKTFGGTLTGANLALNIAGSATEILAGANTYGGATTIGSTATLQLGTGASGKDGTIASSTGITDNGTLVYDRFGNLSTALGIVGSGAVTISGPGSQTFTGALSYSGATTINAGATMQLGNGSVSGSDSSIDSSSSVADNGTLVYNYAGAQQSSQSINGSGNVTVSGPGSLSLNQTSGYTGTTTVNGTLIVAGALSGTPTVNVSGTMEVDGSVNSLSTTTLNGNGTLEGAGSVGALTANGGNIAPGGGITGVGNPVNLTLASNMTLSGSTNFDIRLGVYNYNDNDSVTMTSGTAILNNADLVLTNGGLYSTPVGIDQIAYIILNGGYVSGTSGQFADNVVDITFNNGGTPQTDAYQVVYGYDGNDVALEYIGTAVPEPGTWAMFFGGAGMLLAWQRSRRRKHIQGAMNN